MKRSDNDVVTEFLPLTRSLARRYHRGGIALEDLEQVALEGLIKAHRRFDPQRGIPFPAYAIPTITGELRRYFRDTGWAAHVPRAAQEMAQKLLALDRESDRSLTADEAARELDTTVEAIVEGRLAMKAMFADSLDAPAREDEDEAAPLLRPGVVDRGFKDVEDRATFESRLSRLTARSREIARLRYAEGLSQEAIGQRLGLSQMQISRILSQIHTELRKDGFEDA